MALLEGGIIHIHPTLERTFYGQATVLGAAGP